MLVAGDSCDDMDVAPMTPPSPPHPHPHPTHTTPSCRCKTPQKTVYIHPGEAAGAAESAVLWRVCLAEGLGAALLVGGAALLPAGGDRLARAVSGGLLVAALVQCFARASGAQLNPCVTLAALVCGRVSPRRAALEVAAQLAGATLAAAAARAALGPGAGCVLGAAGAAGTAALEAAGGAVLALANCGEWDARAPPSESWPARAGAVVAAVTLLTAEGGASVNPARHLGPALVNGAWRLCWAYWAPPLAGALLAAALYRAALAAPRPRRSHRSRSHRRSPMRGWGTGAADDEEGPSPVPRKEAPSLQYCS